MFSYVSLEDRIPASHPLRGVRKLVDAVLAEMSKEFDGMYAKVGRPSIPPERLLRALLLQVFYSVRSERMLMEQLDYNLLFRWFVGSGDRRAGVEPRGVQQEPGPAAEPGSGAAVLRECEGAQRRLMSDEHFTVDGTLIEAWASHKSFQRKDGNDKPGRARDGEFPRREAQQRNA